MTDPVTDRLLVAEGPPGVRVLTFNRPEVRNAFDAGLYRALTDGLRAAREDEAVKVVVLTGAGTAFSSGQDLKEMAAIATGTAPPGAELGFRGLLSALQDFDKPLVAAVNGVAVGLGMTLLPYCDLVLVARSARLRVPFAELGVPPEAGSSLLFPERMGWQRAARLLFCADWLDGPGAVAAGLALAAYPDDEVLGEALALAATVAAHPLEALIEMKRLLAAARAPALEAARAREEEAFGRLLGGAANRDALARFIAPGS